MTVSEAIAKVVHELREAAFGRSEMSEQARGLRVHLLGDLKDLLKRKNDPQTS
jgi:hypothetical protein